MFADRLNELIEKKGVSRYQISKATGVTEATLSNYTKGKGNPNTSIVKQLADYFEVSSDWLLRGNGEDEHPPAQLLEEESSYQTGYPAKKLRATTSDLSVLVTFFEKQLAEKDTLINHLVSLLDENMQIAHDNPNSRRRK